MLVILLLKESAMKEFLHVLEHSLIDTAKMLPLLLLVYLLIEFLEFKNVFKYQNSKLLKGKASPVIGSLVGSIPQCGFSVVSSELYAERKISVGALIAVFIATSDEAIPLMLADYKSIPALLLLIATKIVIAIIIGYSSIFLHKKLFKPLTETDKHDKHHDEHDEHKHDEHKHDEHDKHEHQEHKQEEHTHACCHHDTNTTKFNWAHPIIHCVKIAAYIFVINLIMGGLVEIVGEDKLINFLSSSNALQPLFAILIGLIPNCASSVILTELYLLGGISFGSIVTGLSVNAGLGLLILFRKNKNLKENLFIVAMLIIPSLIIGYGLHFLPLNFI